MEIIALQCHEKDNVAVVFAEELENGMEILVKDKKGEKKNLTVLAKVPYGHKVAIKPIAVGEEIIKYGEAIGVATKDIVEGDYVHIHNMDSQRGRGDLEKYKIEKG